ncbi:Hypothetical protein, putative [Bodo saltans]|uniref:Uncharacterized protein n=1 Tax=Bodo saltans TaxID=75058 RepID=A0A0S4IQQ1_BODSA|nr:Hypothetical protein, putative [Bodo saltans]|eukprot:CUF97629.1 Hypothetical protein, putative [Bodo saltans]
MRVPVSAPMSMNTSGTGTAPHALQSRHDEPSNMLLERLRTHFKTSGRVLLFVVGTGVENALKHVDGDPMPASCLHLRAEDFDDLRDLYVKESRLWKLIEQHVEPDEMRGGIFAKLRRLSQNPRMAAMLASVDTEDCSDILLAEATSRGARTTYLRSYVSRVVCLALGQVIESRKTLIHFNDYRTVSQTKLTTMFGAAFAVACSNETQQRGWGGLGDKFGLLSDCCGVTVACTNETQEGGWGDLLGNKFGLLSDCKEPTGVTLSPWLRSQDGVQPRLQLTHRYAMTAATVELGLAGFGLAPPKDGSNSFSQMMMSYLFLHAHGAACAADLGIRLPASVRSDNALAAGAEDPLVPIKDWIRTHASSVNRVTRVELNRPVTTSSDAVRVLTNHVPYGSYATLVDLPSVASSRNWTGATQRLLTCRA